jgi:hypothetical protein
MRRKEWNKGKGKNTCRQNKIRKNAPTAHVPKATEIHINIRGEEVKKGGAFICLCLSLSVPSVRGLHGTGGQCRREFSPEVCKHHHQITHYGFVEQVFLEKT